MEKEIVPNVDRWERDGLVDRDLFVKAGANGFLGMEVPEPLGGGGVRDFRYNVVLGEEVQQAGCGGTGLGLTLHNDICRRTSCTSRTTSSSSVGCRGSARAS